MFALTDEVGMVRAKLVPQLLIVRRVDVGPQRIAPRHDVVDVLLGDRPETMRGNKKGVPQRWTAGTFAEPNTSWTSS